MAMDLTTEDRVKNVIAESLGVDPARVTGEANIHDDLGGDSLDAVEIEMELEDEFKISIPDHDGVAETDGTLAGITKLVEKYLA